MNSWWSIRGPPKFLVRKDAFKLAVNGTRIIEGVTMFWKYFYYINVTAVYIKDIWVYEKSPKRIWDKLRQQFCGHVIVIYTVLVRNVLRRCSKISLVDCAYSDTCNINSSWSFPLHRLEFFPVTAWSEVSLAVAMFAFKRRYFFELSWCAALKSRFLFLTSIRKISRIVVVRRRLSSETL